MGLFDSAQDFLNRGVASAERGTKALSLKAQLGELNHRRERACGQLGESLFEATCGDAALREGREELFAAIEEIDKQLKELNAQIVDLEEESAAARAEAARIDAARAEAARAQVAQVAARIMPSAQAEIASQAEPAAWPCPTCGASVAAEYRFCTSCGSSLPEAVPETPFSPAAPVAGRACPTCGASAGDDDMFCLECGSKLPEMLLAEPVQS